MDYAMQSRLYMNLVHKQGPITPWGKAFEKYENGTQDVERYKKLINPIEEIVGLQKSIDLSWRKINCYIDQEIKRRANESYPNERELALLNSRITKLKAQLSKELQLKKSQRNQSDIKNLQQSINNLTKWSKEKK